MQHTDDVDCALKMLVHRCLSADPNAVGCEDVIIKPGSGQGCLSALFLCAASIPERVLFGSLRLVRHQDPNLGLGAWIEGGGGESHRSTWKEAIKDLVRHDFN